MPANSKAAKVLTAIIRQRETTVFYGAKEDRSRITDESMALRREYRRLRTNMPANASEYLERLSVLEALRDEILALEGLATGTGSKCNLSYIAKNIGIMKVSA